MDSNTLTLPPLILPTLKQFQETCIPQDFQFPTPLMRYIYMNPVTPEFYQKLIKCCKIFFIKNPVLIFNSLNNSKAGGWKYCTHSCKTLRCKHGQKLNFDKMTAKLWFTKDLFIFSRGVLKIPSTFFSRIYRSDVKKLWLLRQGISDEELKFISTGVEDMGLVQCVIIKYGTDEKLLLEEIVKLSFGCKDFWMTEPHHDNGKCKSVSDLLAACKAIPVIKLHKISNDFDLPVFYQLLKKNKNCSKFFISIESPIHPIDDIVNEIFNTDSFDFVPPFINTGFMDSTIYIRLYRIQQRQAIKYPH